MKHIGRDFQGWPVDAHTLEEILKDLGFKENKGSWSISKKSPLLKAYPRLLEDDGMGYGVNAEYITEADKEIYNQEIETFDYEAIGEPPHYKQVLKKETIPVFNFFRERPHGHKNLKDD